MTDSSPPCKTHNGRELGMMLRGEKPLAVFSDAADGFSEPVLRYLRMFDRHAAAGAFVRDEETFPPDNERPYPLHTIYYALPGEAWRIPAIKRLRQELHLTGHWSLRYERREGELLGYSERQNERHIDWLKGRRRLEEV